MENIIEADDLTEFKQSNFEDELSHNFKLSCIHGSLSITRFLLNNYANQLNLEEGLFWAARMGRKKVVEMILPFGTFKLKEISLLAIERSFTDIILVLIKNGLNIDDIDLAKSAIFHNQLTSFEFLCDYGLDLKKHKKELIKENPSREIYNFIKKFL